MMDKRYFRKCSKFFCSVIYILLFATLITSCQTVSQSRIEPESVMIRNSQIHNATHLVLKDSTKISLDGKELYYMSKYKDSVNVLLIKNTEGYKIRDTVKNVTRIYYKERLIPLYDVKDIYVEKSEADNKSTFVIGGFFIGLALIILLTQLIDFKQ